MYYFFFFVLFQDALNCSGANDDNDEDESARGSDVDAPPAFLRDFLSRLCKYEHLFSRLYNADDETLEKLNESCAPKKWTT